MQAVANVIMNRVRKSQAENGYWWGNGIIDVCQKPYQFSCWNKDDPNLPRLMKVDAQNLYFATAMRLARRTVYAQLEDITHGADHYHADYVMPYWARYETPVATIGRHVFHKLA
jgi:spore germination cell wall hydrolase CwlJ-like protein